MKTKLDQATTIINNLREFLIEEYASNRGKLTQEEKDGCPVWKAIEEAGAFLALNSDPDDDDDDDGDEHICADCGRKFATADERDDHFMSPDCPKQGAYETEVRLVITHRDEKFTQQDNGRWTDADEFGWDNYLAMVMHLHREGINFVALTQEEIDLMERHESDPTRLTEEQAWAKYSPTFANMRAALTKTLESARELHERDEFVGASLEAEEAHTDLESDGLALCIRGGFNWEEQGELADYCLKATTDECAEATLDAFEKWVAAGQPKSEIDQRRADMFKTWKSLTPAQAVHDPDCGFIGEADVADYEGTKFVHICHVTLWHILEHKDGTFSTDVSNDGCLFPTMAEVIEWMRPRYFM